MLFILGLIILGVVRHVGRILDGKLPSRPFELLPDGVLLFLIERMLRIRGLGSVRLSKVKGHADEAMVRTGTVRGLDKLGNDGLMRLLNLVVGEFRGGLLMLGGIFLVFVPGGVLLSLCCIASLLPFLGLWLIMKMGQVLLLILLSGLLVVLPRSVGLRCGIGLFYLDRLIFRVGSWVSVAATPITCRDIEVWPYSVGMLVKWVAFLHSLHWPADGCSLGVGGVSYVELLILYEVWAGERIELEKAVPGYRRPGRSISVSAVPFGPGTDIWRSCRFLGALFRGLRDLPFGLRRFVPCDIGANHCRLRHIGWERCGHGLTSRPRESSSVDFLDKLLVLFGYPSGSAAALLSGVLPLRYCSARFAWKLPTWRLPDNGRVRELVTESVGGARVIGCVGVGRDLFPPSVSRAGGSFEDRVLGGVKRIGLSRKHQHTLQDLVVW